jgi:hypothetical protein
MREHFPLRRREKEKVKSQPETREDPALRQGEQVTLVKGEKEGEGLCMHDRCAGEVFFSHSASRCPCLLLLLHVVVDGVFWCT